MADKSDRSNRPPPAAEAASATAHPAKTYTCTVEATVDVAGGKWKPVIVCRLLEAPTGICRFGELKRLIPGVTQRSLTLQLRELERDGIIARRVYAEVPPKVEYSLTPLGHTLSPVLQAMKKWGAIYVQAAELRKLGDTHSQNR